MFTASLDTRCTKLRALSYSSQKMWGKGEIGFASKWVFHYILLPRGKSRKQRGMGGRRGLCSDPRLCLSFLGAEVSWVECSAKCGARAWQPQSPVLSARKADCLPGANAGAGFIFGIWYLKLANILEHFEGIYT